MPDSPSAQAINPARRLPADHYQQGEKKDSDTENN